ERTMLYRRCTCGESRLAERGLLRNSRVGRSAKQRPAYLQQFGTDGRVQAPLHEAGIERAFGSAPVYRCRAAPLRQPTETLRSRAVGGRGVVCRLEREGICCEA